MNTTTPTDLAQFAAQEYLARAKVAQDVVASRRMNRAQAGQKLAPWLAIACLAGADLPQFEGRLADLRTRDVNGDEWCSDAQARALVAADICPAAKWLPLLARARDEAIHAADASQDAAQLTRARNFRRLAEHLAQRAPTEPLPAFASLGPQAKPERIPA